MEQQLAVISILLAVRAAAATVSTELWQVPQGTAGLQYLAALGWARAVQMLLILLARALPALAAAAAAVAVAPVQAALAVPAS